MNTFKKNVARILLLSVIMQSFGFVFASSAQAAPSSATGGVDLKNSLETAGTKANRLKTNGSDGVDLSSGAFTYSYPINLPSGKMGVEPGLALSYNSQNSETGIFGYGWNMNIPVIERTLKRGTDKMYLDNNVFSSSIGGELILKPGSQNEYIQKIDDGSYQLYTFNGSTWTLTDRSGNVYTFGTTLDSKVSDESNGKVAKYYLTNVKNPFGLQVKYFYQKKDGYVYPLEILYTVDRSGAYANRIVFELESSTTNEVSYRTGFKVSLNQRVKRIKVFEETANSINFDFVYTKGQNGYRSLLESISESRIGTDSSWVSQPPVKFVYEKGADISDSLTWTNSSNANMSKLDINGDGKQEDFDLSYKGERLNVIDANGDYLPDLYMKSGSFTWLGYSPNTSNVFRLNTGGNFKDLPINTYNFPSTSSTPNNPYTWWQVKSSTQSDVNGDGLQDIISNFSFGSEKAGAYINNGKGFEFSALYPLGDLETIKGDFNNDGLVDIVKDYIDPKNAFNNGRYVFLNNGSGWNNEPEMSMKMPTELFFKNKDQQNLDLGVRFIDVNLDGLIDIVRGYKTNASYMWSANYMQYPLGEFYELYINTGNSFTKINNPDFKGKYTLFLENQNQGSLNVKFNEGNFQENLTSKRTDVIKQVVEPLGSTVDVSYKGSADLMDGSRQLNPNLPVNLQVVVEVKETEARNRLVTSTSYSYEGGKMYWNQDAISDRRFAGFFKVSVNQGQKKTVKYFHQGDGDNVDVFEVGDNLQLIGQSFKEELFNGSFKASDAYTQYGVYSYQGQFYKYPKYEVVTEYDAAGAKATKVTSYDYDLASRLPKKIVNFGEAEFNFATSAISDKGQDTVTTVLISTNTRPQKFLSEEKFDNQGNFLDKTINLYDGLPFGFVEKGLVTESRNYSDKNNYTKNLNTYNQLGLLESSADDFGNKTSYKYDTAYNLVSKVNALGQETKFTYTRGKMVYSIDANGKEVKSVFDGFGNVIESYATSPESSKLEKTLSSSRSYTNNGLQETSISYPGSPFQQTSKNIYDSFGRLVKSTIESLSSSITTDYSYDVLGRLEKVTYPYETNGSPNFALNSVYFYDALGRNIKTQQGDQAVFTEYGVNWKRVYDNSPGKNSHLYKFDSAGRVISTVEEVSTGKQETRYSYNQLGNLTRIQDALGNIRNLQYDTEGKLIRAEDLHNPSDSTFAVYGYKYDKLGNLISKTAPDNSTFTYTYDQLYRPLTEQSGELKTVYTYDNCPSGVGLLCSVKNSDYAQTISYQKSGQIRSETKQIDSLSFSNSYFYDLAGRLIKVVLPDNSVITYTYDLNGKQKTATLETVENGNKKTTPIISNAKYNYDGTISEIGYGNNNKTCYLYSNNNGGVTVSRLSDIYTLTSAGDCKASSSFVNSTLYSESLKYNLEGKITQSNEKYLGDAGSIESKFAYDELGRLINVNKTENSKNLISTYAYNAIGNITSANGNKYVYDGGDYKNPHAPSLIGTSRMSYDLNGNVLDDGSNQYSWNSYNRLKKAENGNSISEYTYDVSGERIKEVVKSKLAATTQQSTNTYTANSAFTDSPKGALVGEKYYVSKEAYNEFKKLFPEGTTITAELLSNLVIPAYTSLFVSNTCAVFSGTSKDACIRDTTLKVLYAKFKKEKTIALTTPALNELWMVFKGTLYVPQEISVYQALTKQIKFVFNPTTSTQNKTYFYHRYKVTGQVNYTSESSNSNYCQTYNFTTAQYYCVFELKELEVPNTDWKLTSASLNVAISSPLPDKYLNIYKVNKFDVTKPELIDVEKTAANQFKTSPNINGTYRYEADIQSLVNAFQADSNLPKALAVSTEVPNDLRYVYTSWQYQNEIFKPYVTSNYQFTGKFIPFVATSVKLIDDSKVDEYYSSVLKGVINQNLEKPPVPAISEAAFIELTKNKLNSLSKISALFEVAQVSSYVSDTCKPATTDCIKISALKYVASYLSSKHKIQLSSQTLEEAYQVYKGQLDIPASVNYYQKYAKGGVVMSQNQPSLNQVYKYFVNQYNAAQSFFTIYRDGFSYNQSMFDNPNGKLFFSYSISATKGKEILPVRIVMKDAWNNRPVVLSDYKKFEEGNYIIDITAQVKSYNSNFAQFYIEPDTNADKQSEVVITNSKVEFGEFVYLNSVSDSNAFKPVVSQDLLNKGIYDNSDVKLYAAILKEKVIASLFGSSKLISQESFAELNTLGITYTNLIIYDRLIDYSFAPYSKCLSSSLPLSGEGKGGGSACEKEIFTKYLFAIVKYIKDADLSPYALDEIYEMTRGNLAMPNNQTEYVILDEKSYDLGNNFTSDYMVINGYGYFNYQPNQSGYCEIGGYYNGNDNQYVCNISYTLSPDIKNSSDRILKAEVVLDFTPYRQSINQGSVVDPLVPFQAPVVAIYPIVGSSSISWQSNQQYNQFKFTNVDTGLSSPKVLIDAAIKNPFDVTKIISAMKSGQIAASGFRIVGEGGDTKVNAPFKLKVVFGRDATANSRSTYVPQFLNPKDSKVYNDVLKVLARVDREIVVQSDTYASSQSFAEFVSAGITTQDKVNQLFIENEKLQKDETLAAVFARIKTTTNKTLTREALEELFYIYGLKLKMPTSVDVYKDVKNKVFDRSKFENLSVVPGVVSVRDLGSDDLVFTDKMIVSVAGAKQLSAIGVSSFAQLVDLLAAPSKTATSTPPYPLLDRRGQGEVDLLHPYITKVDKLRTLSAVYTFVKAKKSVELTRESLEEIYFVLNGQLVMSGATIKTFDQANLGLLDPVVVATGEVYSVNKENAAKNIKINLGTDAIKVLSQQAQDELAFVGITDRTKLTDIFKATNTVYKDSKIYFLFKYIKDTKGYELTRPTLEEAYMVYTGSLVFPSVKSVPPLGGEGAGVGSVVKEKYAYSDKDTSWTQTQFKGGSPIADKTCMTGRLNGYALDCIVTYQLPKKDGYNVTGLTFTYEGAAGNNLGNVNITVNDNAVDNNGRITLTEVAPAATKYTIRFTSSSIYQTFWNIGNMNIEAALLPITERFDQSSFASLALVSTIEKLEASYKAEIAALPANTQLVSVVAGEKVLTSKDTLAEFNKAGITTVKQLSVILDTIQNPVNKQTLTPDVLKSVKLYSLFKKIKEDKAVELSRVALEEAWLIANGTQILQTDPTAAGASLPATQNQTLTLDKNKAGNTLSYYNYYGTNYYDQNQQYCFVIGYGDSSCVMKFNFETRPGYEISKVKTTFNYGANNYWQPFRVNVGVSKNSPSESVVPQVTSDGSASFDVQGYGAKPPQTVDITKLVGTPTCAKDQCVINLAFSRANYGYIPSWAQVYISTPYEGYQGYWGVKDPYIEIEWKLSDPFFGMKQRQPVDVFEAIQNSSITDLKTAYDKATNTSSQLPVNSNQSNTNTTTASVIASTATQSSTPATTTTTSTVAAPTTVTTPATSSVIPAQAGISTSNAPVTTTAIATNPSTSSLPQGQSVSQSNTGSSTTTPTTATSTQAVIASATTQSSVVSATTTTSTTTPPAPITLAKSVKTSTVTEYIKYYPSSYYEYDTRGFITINIPFNGKVVSTYKYSKTQPTSDIAPKISSELAFLHLNHLGTPVIITNDKGSVVEKVKRNEWGSVISDGFDTDSVLPTSFGFTGYRNDKQTGLEYAHARYYNPKTLIFYSADPAFIYFDQIASQVLNPQTFNSYSYAAGDPINNIDPDGRFPSLGDYAKNIAGYGVGLVQGTVGVFTGTIKTGYNVVVHPINSFNAGVAALDTVSNVVTATIQNPRAVGSAVKQSVSEAYTDFACKSPYEQGKAVGNFFGAIEGSVLMGAGASKVAQTSQASFTKYIQNVAKETKWGDASTLVDHTIRHGLQFGTLNPRTYAKKAQEFLAEGGNLIKAKPNGVSRVYNQKLNTFGAYNLNGTTKTLFKPSTGPAYWLGIR